MSITKPGERKLQILQALAGMLENPKGEKITTAALAEKIDVSEATLYRHFASKAQMFEGLIDFIESSVFGLINQINQQEKEGLAEAHSICMMLLNFSERNPGMTKVLIGDALVNEDDRLQVRMNQFMDRVELALKQALRHAVVQGHVSDNEVNLRANILVNFIIGRWLRFSKTGFKLLPTEHATNQLQILLR